MEINAVDVGGSEGCRRLRELRRLGYVIEKRRKHDSTQFEYRIRSTPTDGTQSTLPGTVEAGLWRGEGQ